MNETKSKSSFWTLGYIAINVLYFCVFCSVHGYASVILLDRGFSNALIGITLATANILSALGQPLIAGIVDKSKKVTNRLVIVVSSAILILAVISLMFVRSNIALVFIIFAFIYALQFIYQSNVIAMNFAYAVFVPASAYYADAVMDSADKVKGQAFINSAITLGGVFSSLICGKILDVFGVKAMLITGTAVCFAGLATIFISIGSRNLEPADQIHRSDEP